VSHKVDVIAACGGADEAFVAKDATSTIPTVFMTGADPVETGLVASLARPGGNRTGVTNLTQLLWQKRVELIAELAQTRVIGLLVNPNRAQVGRVVDSTQQAANAKGLQLEILKAGTEAEIDAEFATAVQRQIGAVVVSDPLFDSLAKQVAAAAARHAVPAIYISRKYVADGGLISYGAIFTTAYHLVGSYVGRILNGAKPADLPVQQSTNFELVVNLKTAKALGLTVPPPILARADEVIE
jgi:putative tryptophan/tyrosine transport system substrate-binding protein